MLHGGMLSPRWFRVKRDPSRSFLVLLLVLVLDETRSTAPS